MKNTLRPNQTRSNTVAESFKKVNRKFAKLLIKFNVLVGFNSYQYLHILCDREEKYICIISHINKSLLKLWFLHRCSEIVGTCANMHVFAYWRLGGNGWLPIRTQIRTISLQGWNQISKETNLFTWWYISRKRYWRSLFNVHIINLRRSDQ